jgi:hypothetical protein
MARPQRNTVDYFPYLCDEGEKMYYIDERYGNDGFATFIKILTHLARTDYHYLDLSKKTTQMFLSAKCKVSTEILNSIINDLAELGKFNLMLWTENKIIWCQDFVDSIQDAYKKRNNECISFEGLLILLDSLGVRKLSKLTTKVSVKTQSKVEYSKEEESKENKTDFEFEEITIEDEDLKEKKSELINLICKKYGLFERQKKERSTVMAYVNVMILTNEDYDYFLDNSNAYSKYKTLSNEKWHGFDGLFGTQKEQFLDGALQRVNWQHKLETHIAYEKPKTKFERTAQSFDEAFNPYE